MTFKKRMTAATLAAMVSLASYSAVAVDTNVDIKVDMNGDGQPDLCYTIPSVSETGRARLSLSDGTAPEKKVYVIEAGTEISFAGCSFQYTDALVMENNVLKSIVTEDFDWEEFIITKAISPYDAPSFNAADYTKEELAAITYEAGSYVKFLKTGYYLFSATPPTTRDHSLTAASLLYVKAAPSKEAIASSAKIKIDGKSVPFEAYSIDGNNYLKLRDLALALKGTKKQFNIAWTGETETLTLLPSQGYVAVGGELLKGDGKNKTAAPSTARVVKGGKREALTAYTIGNNNYFKLRDVATLFDIYVGWDPLTFEATLDTTKGYQ